MINKYLTQARGNAVGQHAHAHAHTCRTVYVGVRVGVVLGRWRCKDRCVICVHQYKPVSGSDCWLLEPVRMTIEKHFWAYGIPIHGKIRSMMPVRRDHAQQYLVFGTLLAYSLL